jgi:hypothetical protein
MRKFLDMCIILYYIGEGDRPDLNTKVLKFVKSKEQDNFLLCYYIKEVDIPKWLKRQRIVYGEVLKKLKDPSYNLYSSRESEILIPRDKKKGLKLLTIFKNVKLEDSLNKVSKISLYIEQQINEFLKRYIDEFVIPISDIDFELKSHLFTFLNLGSVVKNDSDAKTIASAIQENNNQNLTIITADKSDWNKELLQEVHNHYNLKKKYPRLPEIRYLQDL